MNPFKVFRRTFPYLRQLKWQYAGGMLALVCTDLGVMVAPWLFKECIDSLGRPDAARRIVMFAVWIFCAYAFTAFFRYWWRRLLVVTSRKLEYYLRNDYLLHLERMHPEYFHGIHTGDLMSRATSDLNAVRAFFESGIIVGADIFLMIGFALSMMLVISPTLTWWTASVLPVVAVVMQVIRKEIHKRYEAVQEQQAVMSTFVQENFSGMRVVQACAQESFQNEQMDRLGQDNMMKSMRLAKIDVVFHPLLSLMTAMAMVVILWKGGNMVVAGTLTLGAFVAFTNYVSHITWPMSAMGWVLRLYQRGTASMGRLNDILDAEPAIRDRPHATARAPLTGRVAFERVSFTFLKRTEILKDVDVEIPEGSFTAIVGPTGAGKTTLLNLVPRLYEATTGTVTVGGVPVTDLPLAVLRSTVGVVSQEPFLFSDTLFNNIAFGNPDATREEVEAAAKLAALHDSIMEFPQQYDSVIGERGISLSGGQRQRLALARAVLHRPTILLLDDALSSVDVATEEEILANLRAAKGRWTVLFATHRFSAAHHMDRILVMEGGRVVEQGVHEALLAKGGLYTKLYERQSLLSVLGES